MRVGIVAFGTRGDFEPCLSVAIALAESHTVFLVAAESHARTVPDNTEVTVVPLEFAPDDVLASRGGTVLVRAGRNLSLEAAGFVLAFRGHQSVSSRLLHDRLPEVDVLLHTVPGGAGYFLARSRRIPSILVLTQPLLPGARGISAASPFGARVSGVITPALLPMLRATYDYPFRRGFKRVWPSSNGSCPLRTWLRSYQLSGDILDLYSSRVTHSGASASRPMLGFAGNASRPWPQADWDELLPSRPRILVTMGSMPIATVLPDDELIRQGLSAAGIRVLFEADIPEEHRFRGLLNYDSLLREFDAIVHHGGAGTFAASLRAHVPQVVSPVMFDQFYWGHRARDLHVGDIVVGGWRRRRTQSLVTSVQRVLAQSKTQLVSTRLEDRGEVDHRIRDRFRQLLR